MMSNSGYMSGTIQIYLPHNIHQACTVHVCYGSLVGCWTVNPCILLLTENNGLYTLSRTTQLWRGSLRFTRVNSERTVLNPDSWLTITLVLLECLVCAPMGALPLGIYRMMNLLRLCGTWCRPQLRSRCPHPIDQIQVTSMLIQVSSYVTTCWSIHSWHLFALLVQVDLIFPVLTIWSMPITITRFHELSFGVALRSSHAARDIVTEEMSDGAALSLTTCS